METEEQRDETHVEQHGDGDVNIAPTETPSESPENPADGEQPADADQSDGDE